MTNSISNRLSTTVVRCFFAAVVAVFVFGAIFPFIWMLSTSFKTFGDSLKWPPELVPNPITFEAYREILAVRGFYRFFLNSVIFSVVGTSGAVLFSAMAGYAFAKFRFFGRTLLFSIVLGTLMVPFHVIVIPLFLVVRHLGWYDTYLGLIVPGLASAFGIFLIRQFAMKVPDDYFDCARIDGAKEWYIFSVVFVPLCAPAMATLVILNFMARWNDVFWPLIVTRSYLMRTLTLALTSIASTGYTVVWNNLSAALVLAYIPVIIVFSLLQRYFVAGVVLSGIKG